MWNISLALISPSSTTTRLIPISTIVASVCWRVSASVRRVGGDDHVSTASSVELGGRGEPEILEEARQLAGRDAAVGHQLRLAARGVAPEQPRCSSARWSRAMPSVMLSAMNRSTVPATFFSSSA